MKKLLALAMAVALVTFSVPTYADTQDIVDIAVSNPDFSILVTALTEAGLVEALQGDGPFTVFAPTDAAFAELLATLEIEAADLLAHPDLSKVLLYHVVSGKVMSTDLSDGMMPATLNGNTIEIGTTNGVKINQAMVTAADIEASNGVIHVIDSVIIPPDFKLDTSMEEDKMMEDKDMMEAKPDIVDIALSDESFSMLVMLLQEAELVGALQGDGPFTVFAPTNDAFVDLVTALDITPEELMAQPALADVLLYHVISGKVMSTDLSDGLEAATLNGDTIKFDLSSGVMADQANVAAADIEASNGVVHVIDSVLIPEGFVLEAIMIEEEPIPKTGVPSALPLLGVAFASVAGLSLLKKKAK
jgi:transforming growth factor-beta-induced protein